MIEKIIEFFENKWSDIIIAFSSPLCIWLFKKLIVDRIKNYLYQKSTPFSLNGTWISKHEVYFDDDKKDIEIVKFKQQEEKLTCRIEHYQKGRKEILRYSGEGIIKSNQIALFYARNSSASVQTGVMTLKLKEEKTSLFLSGWFYELPDDAKEHRDLDYCADKFIAYSYHLSAFEKLRFFMKKPVYKSYDEIEKKYDEIVKREDKFEH